MELLLSTKRLLRDLKEVLENPLPNVVVAPIEDNLFVWHGNVSSAEGCLDGALIHFALHFPPSYPGSPPEIRLFSPVPHPNVLKRTVTGYGLVGAEWRLAMFDCNPERSAWSSAYSVTSVLVQLQAFLLHDELQYDVGKVSAATAAARARELVCKCCGHTHESPRPSFHPDPSTARPVKRLVTRPFVPARSRAAAQVLAEHQRPVKILPKGTKIALGLPKVAPPAAAAGTPAATFAGKAAAGSTSNGVQKDVKAIADLKPVVPTVANGGPAPPAEEEVKWVEVKKYVKPVKPALRYGSKGWKKGTGSVPLPPPAKVASSAASSSSVKATPMAPSTPSIASSSYYAVLENEAEPAVLPTPPTAAPTPVALTPSKPGSAPSKHIPPLFLTKQAKKNLARSAKRKAKKEGETCVAEPTTPPLESPPSMLAAAASEAASPSVAAAPLAPSIVSPPPLLETPCEPSPPTPPPAAPPAPTTSSVSKPPVSPASQTAGGDDDGWTTVQTKASAASESATSAPSLAQELAYLKKTTHSELMQEVYHASGQTWLPPLPSLLADTFKVIKPKTSPGKDSKDSEAGTAAAAAKEKPTLVSSPPLVAPTAAHEKQHEPESMSAAESSAQSLSMGSFAPMSRDVLLLVMLGLAPSDVGSLAATCRGLRAMCADGEVWKALLMREFPKSALTATAMGEWRHVYQMQSAAVLGDLQCFYTRATFEEEVLGLPLRFTTSPATKCVDYIEADLDLLSARAFASGAVSRSPAGETIQAVLPLYITAEHWERALPLLPRVAALLAPEAVPAGGGALPPTVWLDVIPKIMNTCVVLLCDQGLPSSQRALATYASLHRLLLALAEHYNLWGAAAARLDAFIASPAATTKAVLPNLGHFIPLMALSPRHKWEQMVVPLVNECFDRSVLWMCKADLALAPLLKLKHVKGEVVPEILEPAFKGCLVSRRLILFHAAFLQLVACPRGVPLEGVLDCADALYGRPGPGLVGRFQRAVSAIMAVQDWQTFFRMAGLNVPDDAYLTGWLKDCWSNSLRKGYHSNKTDFSKIQASGVSKILLKGMTYSTPPTLSKVELVDRWRWAPGSGTRYFDASLLLLGPGATLIEAIDFSHTRSCNAACMGAVTHSGDVMDSANHSGLHTIGIKLHQLKEGVEQMLIVMSAYAGASLAEIHQPSVEVKDPDTGVILCEYHLEDLPKETRRAHTSVVMAHFTRVTGSGNGGWRVTAIGKLGQGTASDYRLILEGVKDILRLQ